jgi:hypothetical protein
VPLRLLARAAPFVLGAVAAAIWLRRRHAERPALPARTGTAAPPPPVAEPPGRATDRGPTGRFQRAPRQEADRPPSGRFVRASKRPPVDIVTVVDDLLGAPR